MLAVETSTGLSLKTLVWALTWKNAEIFYLHVQEQDPSGLKDVLIFLGRHVPILPIRKSSFWTRL